MNERKSWILVAAAAAILAAPGVLAGEPVPTAQLELAAPVCALAGEPLVVEATAPASARDVRVYFHLADTEALHFVPATRGEGNRWRAVLPRPSGPERIVLVAQARLGAEGVTRGEPVELDVTSKSTCALPPLDESAAKAARSIVLGVPKGSPEIPEGFGCSGIVNRLDDEGMLTPHDACAAVRLAQGEEGERVDGEGRSGKPFSATSEVSGGVFHHNRPRRTPGTTPPPKPRVDNPRPISPVKP